MASFTAASVAAPASQPVSCLLNLYTRSPSSSHYVWLGKSGSTARIRGGSGVRTAASCSSFNPTELPILKEAIKEPVAFMGGIFAGLLRLDLNEDPLKEWVTRTVEASGITEEEIATSDDVQGEDVPLQIEIE